MRSTLAALSLLIASAVHAASLETELPRLIQAAGIPGASMAVIRDGKVDWVGAAGVIAPGSTIPVRTDTVFRAASLTKPVFAYIVFRLADRGVIDLDAPLAGYISYPRAEHDERHKKITARTVLSHTTGFPNWAWGQDHIPFQFTPGEAWGYSGEGFVYLQKAVEKLTGMNLADLARREVFDPLGMNRSRLVWDPALEGNTLTGITAGGRLEPLPRPTEANAAGSLLTTAEDYGKFLVALLEGRGLRPESREAMFKPQMQVQSKWGEPKSPKQPGIFWGVGWGLEKAEGVDTFWHWGHEDAWRAFTVVRRDGKAGFVYFANSHEGLSIARALSALVVGEPRPSLAWLTEYEQYDDPRRATRKAIDGAFREGGIEAGARRYRELRPGHEMAAGLSDLMMEQNREREAIALLRAALESEPEAAGLRFRLSRALMATGELQAALSEFESAVKLEPKHQWPDIRKWLREGIDAKPVTLPEETLRRLAGSYGPRNVTFEGGSLHYQREGRPKYRLIPIGPTLFAFEGNGSIRVRFAEDGSKLTLLQDDGEENESARTPSAPPPPR
ncbi:MAG TPA: serine hydrolase [Thermoanaerobaculia bacterium]|nr:serine hydrolase [Thermoanaerobaculia bacterium]